MIVIKIVPSIFIIEIYEIDGEGNFILLLVIFLNWNFFFKRIFINELRIAMSVISIEI